MKQNQHDAHAEDSGGLEWLRRELSRRADEVSFMQDQLFPHPVRTRSVVGASTVPGPKTEVIVAVLGSERGTCRFFVTQPFRLLGSRLFGGLQPERESFPRGAAMRLSLCLTANEEIDTSIELTTPSEFQMLVDIDPQVAAQWGATCAGWATRPETIPFGLALRLIEKSKDR